MSQNAVFLLLGLANGAVFASLALALVVTFRSSGVINFATGSIALFTAYVYGFLRQGQLFDPIPGLPGTVHLTNSMSFWPAAALALAITGLFGLLLYVAVFRPIRNAPPVARAVASIGVTVLLTGLMEARVGDNPVNVASIFPSTTYRFGSVNISGDRLWFAVSVVVVALVLASLFRFTRFGLHTRAAAETEKGAYVSGISPDRIAAANWIISAMVAGLAGILISPLVPLVPSAFGLFIVPALAAAMLGRFQGMAVAVAGGLAIGMLQSDAAYWQSLYSWLPTSGLPEFIPLALILIVLVWRAPNLPSRGEMIRSTLGKAPRPRGLLVPTVVSVAGAVIVLMLLHGSWRAAMVTSLILALVTLSQVVVTGFAGQVSLAQLVLAGTAGFLLSPLTERLGVPFPIAPLIAALGAMAIGVIVGLPAVRIRGLPLAVVTLALAVFLEAFWFENTNFVSAAGLNISGPILFGLNLRVGSGAAFPRLAFCFMVLAVLVLVALGVAKLRTGRLGSSMLAVRANERSAAAAGINVARTKLLAFGISAFIAGIGGALLAYQQTNVTFAPFDALLGLGLFAVVYLAGVTSVSGGILAGLLAYGGLVYRFMTTSLHLGAWYDAIAGLGLIITVILNPEGIVGPFHEKAAAWRGRRRQAGTPTAPGAGESETMPVPAVVPAEVEAAVPVNAVEATQVNGRMAVPASPPAPPVTPRVTPVEASILTVQELGVRYGGTIAVDDVSFDVARGTICGLIGPNGAGKTTWIDAVSGFARYSGTVTLDGACLDGLPPHRRTRAGLGRTFQAMELWEDLTVSENVGVGFGGAAKRQEAGTSIDSTLEKLGLSELREHPVSELSQGQRQLVSIARALLGHPKLLLLDEPAAGLDSTESLWLGDRLRAVRDEGVTILLVDHDMGLVLSLCDEIRVLNFGRLVASGAPDAIRGDPVVSAAYLGSTHSTLRTHAVASGQPTAAS